MIKEWEGGDDSFALNITRNNSIHYNCDFFFLLHLIDMHFIRFGTFVRWLDEMLFINSGQKLIISHTSLTKCLCACQIAPAESPDVTERMVIITGTPEAQFKVKSPVNLYKLQPL